MTNLRINYDESAVVVSDLPNLLISKEGSKIESAEIWRKSKRSEILESFTQLVFGVSPSHPSNIDFEIVSQNTNSLEGNATRREISIFPCGRNSPISIKLLLYIPNLNKGKSPVFLGANFKGNEEAETNLERWPIAKIIDSGFALATFHYADLESDHPEGWMNGVRGEFLRNDNRDKFDANQWGAIAAWAWGLSRALDYLVLDSKIEGSHVSVIGHSRLGKAALWAGALDERFAIIISNNSGTGGAKLLRRDFGETIESITQEFPHWFAKNFGTYATNSDALPIDAHFLLALAAPRPLYVASASEDLWADPRGEFLAAQLASSVYELFGYRGLEKDMPMPTQNRPVGDRIGYHLRSGKHGITPYDWDQFIKFARKHLSK